MTARVIRKETQDGTWELAVREPHPRLRPHLLVLEGYEEQMTAPVRQRHLPAVFVPLILNLGSPFRLLEAADPGRDTELSSFVAGLGESGSFSESNGLALCVQVNLTPLGARRILGVPMHELEDRAVDLEAIFGREAGLLAEQLFHTPDWETRLNLVESHLAARLEATPPVRADVAWAWRRLEQTAGRIRIEALASELRCSRKHLLAQFREYVGPGPKTSARLFRFDRLLRLLALDPRPGWAELARLCGYYDQAHLSREVRRFAGCTPRQLADEPSVTFVQDAVSAAP